MSYKNVLKLCGQSVVCVAQVARVESAVLCSFYLCSVFCLTDLRRTRHAEGDRVQGKVHRLRDCRLT